MKEPLTESLFYDKFQLLCGLWNRFGQIPWIAVSNLSKSQQNQFPKTHGCRKASCTLIRTSGSCSSNLVQRSRNNCWCLLAGSITCLIVYVWVQWSIYQNSWWMTYLRLCMLFTYFLLALETVELGKSILLPLKYSGFLLLLLSSVTPIFFKIFFTLC